MSGSKKLVIGLTGGIGSGKTTVADAFAALGAAVVDTDKIAHALTGAGGAAMPALRAAFGAEVVSADGSLDRAVMRQRCFADPAERCRLEAILHPLIRVEADAQVAEALVDAAVPYVLLVVPLLVETGAYRDRVACVAVVDCDEATQVARVMARSGLSADAVSGIMAAQVTRAQRLQAADQVIGNDGDLAALAHRVAELDRTWRRESSP